MLHTLSVAPLLDCRDDDEVRASYTAYMTAGRALKCENPDTELVEVLDLSGCSMSLALTYRLPLLVELLRTGNQTYDHADRTIIVGAPDAFRTMWLALQSTTLSFLAATKVEFAESCPASTCD